MCGICGVIGFTSPASSADIVRKMTRQMVHRGPDDEGRYADGAVAFGMRRLSIIDIPGGHQPVFNEDGSVAVVFNGEIYNFRELRRQLASCGHTFRSHSDTEVIVHAYEEWGDDCISHLEGMFAFAVMETASPQLRARGIGDNGSNGRGCKASPRQLERRVLLARDRLGIKPLYYAEVDGGLIFASELRALLASGLIEPRLSASALHSYLLFGSVMEPLTLIEGVHSLPPGHRLAIDMTMHPPKLAPEPYWNFGSEGLAGNGARGTALASHDSFNRTSPRDRTSAASTLRSLLEEAVESHLIADVPIGVFLSSGIDSTALVALAAQKKSSLHTVTLVFAEQEFNEGVLARRTAQRFATRHQELQLSGNEMLLRLVEAVGAFDQPSMDGINSYFVSWAARQAGLKVALSGLGGDELFGGYSTFRTTRKAVWLSGLARRVPDPIRSMLAAAMECGPDHLAGKQARHKIAALWRDPDYFPHPYFYTRLLFTPRQASGLLARDSWPARQPWQDTLARITAQSEGHDDFTAISCLESQSYMANTLLRDTDCMSMAHSLEVRVPLLHPPLVEFVSGLPGELKRNNGVPKSLLVEAMGGLLPAEVVAQRKRTFTLPWEHWLRGPLKEEVAAELNSMAGPLADVLDASEVRGVWTSFLERKTSWSRVWSLFVLSRWARQHLADTALRSVALVSPGRASLQARVGEPVRN